MTVKFRENALTAVSRDQGQIIIHVRKFTDSELAKARLKNPETQNETLKPIVLRYSDCSDAVRAEAMGYGLEVRLTRAAAIEHAKAGRAATAQERWDAIARLAAHYATGTTEWAMSSAGGGGLSAETQDLIEALVIALEIERDVAEAQVRTFTSAQRSALRNDPEVRSALEMVWSQRGAGVDTQALKDSLKKG